MSGDPVQKERLSALEKALVVLEAVADQSQAVGLPDLAERVGLPRQTVHRVLKQLEEKALLVRHANRERYAIGPRLSRLALSALSSTNQGAPIRQILRELVDDIQETCNVGVLQGLDFIYIDRIECHWSLRVHLQAGSHVPAYCTSGGKVLLASLEPGVRGRLLRCGRLEAHTPNTIVNVAELERVFAEIRDQRFAVNDQEYTVGITGVAVPITDEAGRAVASLALHGPSVRLPVMRALRHVPKLQFAAKRLAQVMQPSDAAPRGCHRPQTLKRPTR